MFFSVLDIFQIQPVLFQDKLYYSAFFEFFFSHALFILLLASLCIILFFGVNLYLDLKFYPSSIYQLIAEYSIAFVVYNVHQKLALKGQFIINLFFVTFFLVLFSNLISLLPYSFTPTAQIVFTFFLSASFFILYLVYGIYVFGRNFFSLFFPKMEPWFLRMAVALIEVLSFTIRLFSLSIRLFANMFAGHVLLHVVSTVVFNSFISRRLFNIFNIFRLLFSFIFIRIRCCFCSSLCLYNFIIRLLRRCFKSCSLIKIFF